MSIKEILSSDSNLSVTIKSTDLKEFADHIIKQTIKEVLASNMKSDEEYLTVNETAKMLCVNRSTLWSWNKKGYLCPVEIGGKRRYKISDSLSKHLLMVIISIVTVAGCIYAGNVEMNDDILSGMSFEKYQYIHDRIGDRATSSDVVKEYLRNRQFYDSIAY